MFQKTNSFFHRTLHSLKSIILRAGKKLPRPTKANFSCTFCRSNSLHDDKIYASFLNIWDSDLEYSVGSSLKLEQKCQEQEQYQEKKTEACSLVSSRDCVTMAKKIKELDMVIETGDIEQALDVEEALHYYSLLRSPAYLNIVDKFFDDLYT